MDLQLGHTRLNLISRHGLMKVDMHPQIRQQANAWIERDRNRPWPYCFNYRLQLFTYFYLFKYCVLIAEIYIYEHFQ